ncbi:MAG TPA: hypothetical protein VGD64_00720, partial [Acidisarcina sp.]
MSTHIHLVAVQHRNDSLSRALGRTHAEYAQYLNLSHRSSGHVWQARFFSCPLSGHYTWNAMAYVERKPVRAHLTARASHYDCSSARAHTRQSLWLTRFGQWWFYYNGRSWQKMAETDSTHTALEDQLREATQRGRPCADEKDTEAFEHRLGRLLRAKPPGRR